MLIRLRKQLFAAIRPTSTRIQCVGVRAALLSTKRITLPEFAVFHGSAERATSEDDGVRAHPAVLDSEGSYSHGRLLKDTSTFADVHLRDINPNDRIAFLTPRTYLHPLIQFSIWQKSAIPVPLCTSHKSPDLLHVINDCTPRIVFYAPQFTSIIETVRASKTTVEKWIQVTDVDFGHADERVEVEWRKMDKGNGGLIIYTSGTTGKPKGQVLSLLKAWEWTRKDKIQLLLPLHHVHGLINVLTCGIAAGATVEMVPGKFDPEAVWNRWMEKRRDLTLFMAVPTIYAKLARYFKESLTETEKEKATAACSQFRLMVSGSSALPDPLSQQWTSISNHTLLERYGMTEIGMALGNPLYGSRIAGTVGKPFPGMQCKIVNEDGKEVEKGGVGELLVKGPQVLRSEYWGRPDATRESFTEDGCLILGRASIDIIKSGGHKISALDVERHLLSHPSVRDVCVVGIPDDEWGERVAAVVVMDGDVEG
ncbi:hypothetical protein BC829DRAFT_400186 [Chytridium lagenaria]|nr:hypothetical protein BC829DRAFT_400186 [Chytridium lagenaria]